MSLKHYMDKDVLTGCSSHACLVSKPVGMGTNSGKCYCTQETIRRKMDAMKLEAKLFSDAIDKSNAALAKAVHQKAALEVVLNEHDQGHSPCSCPEIRKVLGLS